TLEFSTQAFTKHLDQTEQARKKLAAERGPAEEPTAEPAPPPAAPPPELKTPRNEAEIDTAPVMRIAPEAVAEPAAVDVAPLSVAEARAALGRAENRDEVFGVLLRALRSRCWYAGLLTIQGRAAIGRIAIAGDSFDRDSIAQVLIPIDDARAFNTAVTSAAPYIGPVGTGDGEIDGMVARMGGVVPPAALLLPIAIKSRVVALAIGHRGADTLGAAEVADLLPLAGAAADALSRIIVKTKSVGYRAADSGPAAPAPLPVDDLPTRKHDRGGQGWARPAEPEQPRLDLGAAEVTVEPDEREPATALIDRVEGADAAAAADAAGAALIRPDDVLPVLAARFPGRLEIDRSENPGRPLRAAEHGPLLGLIVQLGSVCADMLIDKMKDPHRDVRYFATLCTAELRPRSALRPLIDRLFDNDFGVRGAAVDALSGYPVRELEQSFDVVRHALHAEDPKRVQAAANAVAELADVKAIPDLLDAIAREDEGSPHARRAMVLLTKQDFGNSARKWRGWWDKARGHHRIEWLIDGLGSKDEPLRKSAIEDLRKLTGEYFGYHFDLPRKDRDAARERWLQWWNDIGRRRFLRADTDERHRPTAVLPVRRDQ
ncbi:MAG TPA: HEAT repeat domain-containing protein, partial [Kofleriaceae bacterium]|nr:HEAT repeat domain-containing protein [Kofleriaceae bacterium]